MNFDDPIAFDKDIIALAHSYTPRIPIEHYKEIWNLTKKFMAGEIKNNDTPAFYIPHIGTMYIKLKDAAQNFVPNPKHKKKGVSKAQTRYEFLYNEIMDLTHTYHRLSKRQQRPYIEKIMRRTELTFEEIEKIQQLESEK